MLLFYSNIYSLHQDFKHLICSVLTPHQSSSIYSSANPTATFNIAKKVISHTEAASDSDQFGNLNTIQFIKILSSPIQTLFAIPLSKVTPLFVTTMALPTHQNCIQVFCTLKPMNFFRSLSYFLGFSNGQFCNGSCRSTVTNYFTLSLHCIPVLRCEL